MRAPFILAAVLAVGANAAGIRRDDTTTTLITPTTEVEATTTATSIFESATPTETIESTMTTETSTPTETETDSDGEDSDSDNEDDDVDDGLWKSLMADCSNSTVPRSNACVAQMWHTTGCVAPVPADMLPTWANVEDSAALKAEMKGYYANATAGDATKEAKDACHPVPKPIMVAVNCVHNVTTDMCKDCFSTTNFLGFQLPKINATCVESCLRDPANADAFAEVCPNAGNLVQCKDTLNSTCGQCVSEKPGNILGLPILDVDEDCFKDCYSVNNATIREACPLPAPIKSALDCHQTLAEECGECVDDEHDIDSECLDGCLQDKIYTNATLNETCPPQLISGFATLDEIMPSEDDIKTIFETLLSQIQLPAFDLSGLLGGLLGANQGDDDDSENEFMGMIQGLLSQLQNQNGNGEIQTFITNILSQLGLGPVASPMGVVGTTTTIEATETETETSTATSTETSTETETETDN